jgi:hypothetical protein
VGRRARFYVVNVVMLMCALNVLGLLAFAMPLDDVTGRVSTLLTLLLTAVAFKLFLAGIIPRISYNTLLDHYVLLSTALLGLTAFAVPVPNYVPDLWDPTSAVTPRRVNSALAAIGLIFSLALVVVWSLLARRRRTRAHAGQGDDAASRKPIAPFPGRTWLAFRYYPLAAFLRPPPPSSPPTSSDV